jgi:predicted nucleotidyltransferase
MSATSLDDPVLQRFRRAASEAHGSRIERVVLFGSRTRERTHGDAEYDVAVFIKDPGELWGQVESNRA